MSQKQANDIASLQKRVTDLEEKVIALVGLVAAKRRTKDMMQEVRSETH